MAWSRGGPGAPALHVAASTSRVRLDLNSPGFQDVFFRLELAELKQVVTSLRRLAELDWISLYRHTGFRWEAIAHIKSPNGATVHSLRLSQKVRAVPYRDGEFLRFISLHPDHDSAYGR
jgi:hypothetical protein